MRQMGQWKGACFLTRGGGDMARPQAECAGLQRKPSKDRFPTSLLCSAVSRKP